MNYWNVKRHLRCTWCKPWSKGHWKLNDCFNKLEVIILQDGGRNMQSKLQRDVKLYNIQCICKCTCKIT